MYFTQTYSFDQSLIEILLHDQAKSSHLGKQNSQVEELMLKKGLRVPRSEFTAISKLSIGAVGKISSFCSNRVDGILLLGSPKLAFRVAAPGGLQIFIFSRNCHWLWLASTRELKIPACRRKKLGWTSFFILPTKKGKPQTLTLPQAGST